MASGQRGVNCSASAPVGERTVSGSLLQRKCACAEQTSDGAGCGACEKESETALQRSAIVKGRGGVAPRIVHEVLSSGGQPLDRQARGVMENHFEYDFSHVRVHTDGRAADSASAVSAQAYTVGHNIVFGANRYAPTTTGGKALLAHELAHVIQQGRKTFGPAEPLQLDGPGDGAEAEAAGAAQSFMGGTGATKGRSSGPVRMQRLIDPSTATTSTQATSQPGASPPPASASPASAQGAGTTPCPDWARIKSTRQYNHGTISSDRQEQFRTYLSNIATMEAGPGPDYSGHKMQENLIMLSNNCPARLNSLSRHCAEHAAIPIEGKTLFIDGHVTKNTQSLLEGTGVSNCQVTCHQTYRCDTDSGKKAANEFLITRNYQAGTYTNKAGQNVHITTGSVDKTELTAPPKPELQDAPQRTLPKGMEYA